MKKKNKIQKELQLVNYKQAVGLEKMGFNWHTDAHFMCLARHDHTEIEKPVLITERDYYHTEEGMRSSLEDKAKMKKKHVFACASCPTIQLAFKFLRTKGFDVEIMRSMGAPEYTFEVFYGGIGITRHTERSKSYEEAERGALNTILNYEIPKIVPTAPAMEIDLKKILSNEDIHK